MMHKKEERTVPMTSLQKVESLWQRILLIRTSVQMPLQKNDDILTSVHRRLFPTLHTFSGRKAKVFQRSPKWQALRFILAVITFGVGLAVQFILKTDGSVAESFYVLTMTIGGYALCRKGLVNLLHGQFEARTLLFLPLLGLFLLDYWLEGAFFALLCMLHEGLETYALLVAKRSLTAVDSLQPRVATIQRGRQLFEKKLDEIAVGEFIVVNKGERIPLDGVIIFGETFIHEKEGPKEVRSIRKKINDVVYAGWINERSEIVVRVTKRKKDTRLASFIAAVKRAQCQQAPAEHFMNNFLSFYVPMIMLLALFVATLPPLMAGGDWAKWVYISLAILIVACPCALVISTSITLVMSLSAAAKRGILINGGETMENISEIDTVIFDSLGTLLTGTSSVAEVFPMRKNKTTLIQIAASIAASHSHPFYDALVSFATEKNISLKRVENFRKIDHDGFIGTIDEKTYTIGSEQVLTAAHEIQPHIGKQLQALQASGMSIVTVSTPTALLGFFALQHELHPEASNLMNELKRAEIKRFILFTEHTKSVASWLAKKFDLDHFFAHMTVERKQKTIQKLQQQHPNIAFVSKQLAPTLSTSSTSVHIVHDVKENGTTFEQADVAFLSDFFTNIPSLMHVSKKTVRTIKVNLAIVFLFKMATLFLVIPNMLTVWLAMLIDLLATTIVLYNMLRLTSLEGKR